MPNEESLGPLLERLLEPTRRYAIRRASPEEAEEAVSETMLFLVQHPERIPNGGERSWAIGVCRKMLANLRRKRTRREGLIGRFIRDLIPPSPPPLVLRDEELASALAVLPASDQEALLLAVWDELPPREIAKVLGISANAAAIRVHRAKRRLRERLEPQP